MIFARLKTKGMDETRRKCWTCITVDVKETFQRQSYNQSRHRPHIQMCSSHTYASLLRWCGKTKALSDGKRIHVDVISHGLQRKLESCLALMYVKCGTLADAISLFTNMQQRNVSLWNCIIKAHICQGQGQKTFPLFDGMQQEGVLPNDITFVVILDACACLQTLAQGEMLFCRIADERLKTDIVLCTALLNMYAKCGRLSNAIKVFYQMPERDIIAWTTMIGAYVQNGHGKQALQLFDQMQLEGLIPNKITFSSVLVACTSQKDLSKGLWMHACILNCEVEMDLTIRTALVDMYGKCGSLEKAQQAFDKMPKKNVVSWNVLISVYALQGKSKLALQLFLKMQKEGMVPNKVTCINTLASCTTNAALPEGEHMHMYILKIGLESDVAVSNALINMYGKCGSLEGARRAFNKMPTRDVVSWNAMISVYAQSGHWKEALQLYDIMKLNGFLVNKVTYVIVLGACVKSAVLTEGRKIHDSILNHGLDSDVTIGNALLYMYSMCVRPDDAQIVFDKMIERDVISWTVMIAVYAQLGQVEIAIHLFKQMQQKGVVPNKVTCIIILAACATQVALIEGQSLHAHILACKYDLELMVGNALVNMYGKCGSWMDARLVFDKMSEQDVISCNAMIAVCAQHGRAKDALQVFTQMLLQAIKPNEVTFLCILTACSHAGLVEEGCDCFHFMKQDHEIALAVEHYICMVDLLGRAGWLEEAEYLMTDMPFQPSFGPFMALLGACRYQADRKRGYRIAKHLSELDLQNAAPYVMLANVYAAADKEDDAENVLDSMMSNGLKKQPSHCSIRDTGWEHHFFSGHQWNSLNDQNFSELALLDSMKVSCSDVCP